LPAQRLIQALLQHIAHHSAGRSAITRTYRIQTGAAFSTVRGTCTIGGIASTHEKNLE
jgi:hypothetical protein